MSMLAWEHGQPRLGMAAPNSLAHPSSRASAMAHPFLWPFEKMLWRFSRRQQPPCFPWVDRTEICAVMEGFITVFYFFHNKNIDAQDNIRPQILPRKSLSSSLWLCYYFLIRIQLTIQPEIENTLRSCNTEKLKEQKKKERKKKVEDPKPFRAEHAHMLLLKQAKITQYNIVFMPTKSFSPI